MFVNQTSYLEDNVLTMDIKYADWKGEKQNM